MNLIPVKLTPVPGENNPKRMVINPLLVVGLSRVRDKTRVWLADGQVVFVIDPLDDVLPLFPQFIELRSALADNALWVNPAMVAHCIESGESTEIRMMGGETFLASEDFATVFHALS